MADHPKSFRTVSPQARVKRREMVEAFRGVRCPYCRTTGEPVPLEKHIRRCWKDAGRVLPAVPPKPPILSREGKTRGRDAAAEAAFRAGLSRLECAAYYKARFEEGGYSWEASLDMLEKIIANEESP